MGQTFWQGSLAPYTAVARLDFYIYIQRFFYAYPPSFGAFMLSVKKINVVWKSSREATVSPWLLSPCSIEIRRRLLPQFDNDDDNANFQEIIFLSLFRYNCCIISRETRFGSSFSFSQTGRGSGKSFPVDNDMYQFPYWIYHNFWSSEPVDWPSLT